MSAETLTLPARFNGPPRSANGGYAAGRLGALVDAPVVTVRLLRPPPLDVPLEVRTDGEARGLWDGETQVAVAEPGAFTGAVPSAPSLEDARAAQAAHPFPADHPFPTCFGCGPGRSPDEAVRAHLGPLPGTEVWAGTWIPTARLPHAGDLVDPAMVWVALDCPSAQPVAPPGGAPHVLASFTVALGAPVQLGVEHLLLAWPAGEREGRKARSGSAVLRPDGTLCGRAEALWITLRPER